MALTMPGAVAMAADAPDPAPELELIAERRVAVDSTSTSWQFVPAVNLEQGQEIYYTLRIRNPAMSALRDVQVTQAIPSNTRYVAKSATGTGALVSFSIDGEYFAPLAELKNADGLPVTAAQVTHIRWQFPYSLPPQAVVLARFRAVFQ